MLPTAIIEKLNSYEFHDMDVESILFQSDPEIQLIVTASPYNHKLKECEKLRIIFSGILELKTDEIILDQESRIEFYTFDYDYKEAFTCKMGFLLGFGKPSLDIDLKCEQIKLEE